MVDEGLGEAYDATRRTVRLATEEEEREAKEAERSLREAAKAWSCNHCFDYLGVGKTESLSLIRRHLNIMCVL